jgi:hypothetical protein
MNREDEIREIQERYRQSGPSLNELERRHWAAAEATRLGWGGIAFVSEALRISPNTIRRGIQELAAVQAGSTSQEGSRIRKPGGGRKSKKATLDQTAEANPEVDSTGSARS